MHSMVGALLLLALFGCANDAAGPTRPQASAFLRNRSPWSGTLSLMGPTGLIAGLHAAAGDSTCVTFQTAPPDSVTGTATIAIPVSAHIRAFRWSFNGEPYLAVELDGDSVGPVISSSIGLANAPAGCIP